MKRKALFRPDPTVADRQPKTDRLMVSRLLREFALRTELDEQPILDAHPILVKWAELETSGALAKLNEIQLEGDFLAQVFGEALGYAGPADEGVDQRVWHRQAKHEIEGKTPDAILGMFSPDTNLNPLAVVELKGPTVHLDRDRSNGRTAVDQCWDYLVNTPPACRWGIVSNIVSFRLYERNNTKRIYEHFTLQSLRKFEVFKEFYILFHRQGLVEGWLLGPPRAVKLLEDSAHRQRDVSDKLYDLYSNSRHQLIEHLHFVCGYSVNEAIDMSQRLLDRIMFVAFCEDRGLLPEKTIYKALTVEGFHAVTNPKWQAFKHLFRFIDNGHAGYSIPQYNGGLFAPHPVDDLDLPDSWTNAFRTIGEYNFADEVNLDVLGNLFERSITELEKKKHTGLYLANRKTIAEFSRMPQSEKRKRLGIYYTPPELTGLVAQLTLEELILERFAIAAVKYGVPREEALRRIYPTYTEYWQDCLQILREFKVLDPACGSGVFLFQAYSILEQRYLEVVGHLLQRRVPGAIDDHYRIPRDILNLNLYGVDLSPEAVEIAQLALWIRSAAPGQLLANLSHNVVLGNSLVHDSAVHPLGFDWRQRFPEVFDRDESGFDCIIGNPPWERMKLQEREFFSLPAPEIATSTHAAKRRQLVARLEAENPELFTLYEEALTSANSLLDYCRTSDAYPLTGQGDINTYAVFAELATQLVAPHGRVGLLVPSGIASDNTTKDFFASLIDASRLIRLYDFENRYRKFFPSVDNRFKFCFLNVNGAQARTKEADFAFFLHDVEELEERKRHFSLTARDIKLVNPNTRTCPIFRTRRDAEITKRIYRNVRVLIDKSRTGPTANPWHITFKRMFDQTNDAELFLEPDVLKQEGYKLVGNQWKKGKKVCLPVYEAKMIQAYDHRAANVVTQQGNWMRQGQKEVPTLIDHQNPEYLVIPRFWIAGDVALDSVPEKSTHFLCIKDVTSPTNQRTMIASFIPFSGVVNSAPILLSSSSARLQCCLLACLNSFAYDYVMRQKISNLHLNFFIVEQLPTLEPSTYAEPCRWQPKVKLETWISERVLKLTCTAVDMLPLAEACKFKTGSFKQGYAGQLNKWVEAERAELRAELDAAYFHLYGITRDDAEYILSSFKGIHERGTLFPENRSEAEYILEKYDALAAPE